MVAVVRDGAGGAPEMIEYRHMPAVLVIADSTAGADRAGRAAELSGCRVVDRVEADEAAARIERNVGVDALLIDLTRDHGAELDRLLEAVERVAREGRSGCVVCAPASLIDAVAARTPHRAVQHLCDPSEFDWIAAAASASAPPEARLHDIRKQTAPPSLHELSEEVRRIASILSALSEEERSVPPPVDEIEPGPGEELTAGQIRAIIRARRLRCHYFRDELFADPAWDMLLDLMAARLEEERVAVSSLCIAAAVPPTTALRWIKTLTDQGLFVRVADPQDGRRVFIGLSDDAAAQLVFYLRAVHRISPLAL